MNQVPQIYWPTVDENVQELLNAIAEYAELEGGKGMLSGFLQEVSLFTDVDKDDADEDRMTLMTLHASKGLEFPVVFVAGLEEGLFPLAAAAQDRKELEEERRLFYVGVTRAKEYLVLSYARSRFRYGEHQPSIRSRFLEEAAREKLERLAMKRAIRKGAGLLKASDHPEWRDTEAVKEWVRASRRGG